MRRITVGLAICLLAAGFAAAQDTMKPAPEMEQLKGFEGTWTCSGNVAASAFGPAHKTQGTVQGKRDLNGFWVVGAVKETKTAENPHPMHGMFHMTYDAAEKQYRLIWLDSTGSWATSTSPGWQGNTMTFTGEQTIMGQKVQGRDTFVKKTERDWEHRFELNTAGNWEAIVQENCRKK
jgi:hypothetical protein